MPNAVTMRALVRSFREAPTAERVGEVDQAQTVHLTVVLKPRAAIHPARYAGGQGLAQAEFGDRHGSSNAAVEKVVAYARQHGLQVDATEPGRHAVKLSGTYAQAAAAFQPENLGIYQEGGGKRFVSRAGHLHLPPELLGEVVAVQGFDQRPVAWPHFRLRPHAADVSYDPAQIGSAYQFPTGVDGAGQTIALIELGGGYRDADVAAYFAAKGINRTGRLTSVPVDTASNTPGDPSGADGEVQLDIEVAGCVAPGADIALYFAPNTGAGFLDGVQAAIQAAPSVISISWGGAESGWAAQDLDAMDQAFQSAAAQGITVCVASGDNGALDRAPDGQNSADFPASSLSVLGCGGTSLPSVGGEVAWNDGNGAASGGGFSAHFAQPTYQQGITGSGRGVPDVSGDADPNTGYNVSVDGQPGVSGGTSAVAPLWAGLVALINQSLGRRVGFINPILYANPAALNDITAGDNGGYSAGPGWDPVTGLGSPRGQAVLAALQAASTAPPTS